MTNNETILIVNEVPLELSEISTMARICHEVNRAYCESLGDFSQLPWEKAPVWQSQSCFNGVLHHLANPNTSPEESHEVWLKEKLAAGWKYGPLKDATKREHPCCVPYAELKESDKAKDFIFRACVRELMAAKTRVAPKHHRWKCSYCNESLVVPAAADSDESFVAWSRKHVETACPNHPLRAMERRISDLGVSLLEATKRAEAAEARVVELELVNSGV